MGRESFQGQYNRLQEFCINFLSRANEGINRFKEYSMLSISFLISSRVEEVLYLPQCVWIYGWVLTRFSRLPVPVFC